MPVDEKIGQRIVDLMNEALSRDPDAIAALVSTRVPCNTSLVNHPTIQCGSERHPPQDVGLLGILNGLAGIDEDGWGCVAAIFEGDGRLGRFKLLTDDDRRRRKERNEKRQGEK